MEILELIIEILNNNPFAFMAIFVISLLANIIQIYTFIADRRRLKDEIAEKNKLLKLVETYEYLLNLAQKNIKTEAQLKSVEQEIAHKSDIVGELASRAEILEKNAQRKLISQVIERNISVLAETYEDIKELRKEYKGLGYLPDIPIQKRDEIEAQINLAIRRPYEFPKSFLFKSIILVLFVFLLPSPVDTILILAFLGLVLEIFFEAVWLFDDVNLSKWTYKYKAFIVYGSAYLIWRYVISFAVSFFIYQPLDISKTLSAAFTINRTLIENMELVTSGIMAYLHGRLLMIDRLTNALSKLDNNSTELSQGKGDSTNQNRAKIRNLVDRKHLVIVGAIILVAIGISFGINLLQKTPNGQIGQDILVSDIRWNVVEIQNLGTKALLNYGTDQFINASNDHIFVLVEVEIENQGKESIDINSDKMTIFDSQERRFSAYSEMYDIVPNDKRCTYFKLNPNAARICQVVYEIPSSSQGLIFEIAIRVSSDQPEKKIIINLGE